MADPLEHPCLACGACCAAYRVDFAVYEIDEHGGSVPAGLAAEVTGNTWRMRPAAGRTRDALSVK